MFTVRAGLKEEGNGWFICPTSPNRNSLLIDHLRLRADLRVSQEGFHQPAGCLGTQRAEYKDSGINLLNYVPLQNSYAQRLCVYKGNDLQRPCHISLTLSLPQLNVIGLSVIVRWLCFDLYSLTNRTTELLIIVQCEAPPSIRLHIRCSCTLKRKLFISRYSWNKTAY